MLRDYQHELKNAAYGAWQDPAVRNVMVVAPTGSGKTVLLGSVIQDFSAPTVAIAHRQELVSQLALALNREGVPHGIIAPTEVIRTIVNLEMESHGRSYFNARAACRVAGVHTLNARDSKDRWFNSVQLAVIDEGHHALRENIWGRALAMFPNARGLLPTAHAVRADGAGLGRHADGVVDRLAIGPSCRELINRGYLTDYRLICPPSDVDVSDVPISPGGDFSPTKLRAAVHRSGTIVGDVARHYLKFAAGKMGITFAVDVEAAREMCAAYQSYGVPAAVVTADTPVVVRAQLMRKLRARELLQLVNVDVLGEGVDVPALEVVSMARHTASFQTYAQQFGRALRLMIAPDIAAHWDRYTDAERLAHIARSVKPKAIIIDHVNNMERHMGPPDKPRVYTLDRRERRPRLTQLPSLRSCVNADCLQAYERYLVKCPHCGNAPEPRGRGSPEQVEGDLVELDPEVLAALRGEIARIDGPAPAPVNASRAVLGGMQKHHANRQTAQLALRDGIALWAGWQQHLGHSDREGYRKFFHAFGVDVATAQTLGAREAQDLEARVRCVLMDNHVVKL